MGRKLFFSVLTKLGSAIYGLFLLKILSIYLEPDFFSKYYLGYNISLYLYTFLFTIQINVLLRFYHSGNRFSLTKFLHKLNVLSFFAFILFDLCLVFVFKYDWLHTLLLLVFCASFGFYNLKITLLRIKGQFDNIFVIQIIQIAICILLLLLNRDILNPNLIFCITSLGNFLPFIFFKNRPKFKFIKFNYINLFNSSELKYFNYGKPILLIAFITYALSSSDQFFLKYYGFNQELSGYIVNYSIAEKGILIFLSVLSFVFQPFFFKKHNHLTKSALYDVMKVSFLYLIVSLFIFIIVFNFSTELTSILSSRKYINSSWIIPIVLLGGVFIGLNSFFGEILTLTYKTSLLLISYIIGIFTNVIINYFFIPQYGVLCAIWSSVFAYFVMFISITLFVTYQFKKNIHEYN